ncbi:hypothetical protein HMSSN036_09750 [Paenibacillus macerans]|nr:hypothetical protein HMSSN036_09750 [Paenibacillus macerans]
MANRSKEDIAKLVLIWWCLYAFIASGYEHSVANMTLLSLSLLLPNHPDTITLAGWLHNMIPVTLGNIIGGGGICGHGVLVHIPGAQKGETSGRWKGSIKRLIPSRFFIIFIKIFIKFPAGLEAAKTNDPYDEISLEAARVSCFRAN